MQTYIDHTKNEISDITVGSYNPTELEQMKKDTEEKLQRLPDNERRYTTQLLSILEEIDNLTEIKPRR